MAVTWASRCLLWGCLSASFTAYIIKAQLTGDSSCGIWQIAAGACVVLGTLSTVVSFHIATLRCSQTHTLKTLLLQYVIYLLLDLCTPFFLFRMSRAWRHPRRAQEAFLLKLITRDADTEYGRRYLSGIDSLEEYRKKHPLTKYDHYEEYFKRLADGEKNVCVADEISRFGISSGTTGKGKLIPMVVHITAVLLVCILPRYVIKSSPVQKAAFMYCKPARKMTKTGKVIAPAFLIGESSLAETLVNAMQSTPFSAFQITKDYEATYIHLLFALADRDIYVFVAPFASQLYRAFAMLEDEQDMLLEDLTEGRVNPRLNIDDEIRRSLDAALKPNPTRAKELKEEMARGFVGIVGRIWPHIACLMTVDISGYMNKLNARYTKGVKFHSTNYGCTEAFIGLNLWMDGRPQQYVFVPNESMVEFIPEEYCSEDNPDTLLIDEIEVGRRYEIAVTASSGFYRYRMGDVVEVVDFHEKCPVIQVKYRTGELLNLRSEKIDKLVVNNAVRESLTGWPGASLVEWTCAESPLMHKDGDASEYDMFYLIFVELESKLDVCLSAEQKSLFDKSLRKQHEMYDNYRRAGTICEARVFLVAPGSFQRLKEFIIATSTASYNQFKMPKKLRTKATLDLMMENVLDETQIQT